MGVTPKWPPDGQGRTPKPRALLLESNSSRLVRLRTNSSSLSGEREGGHYPYTRPYWLHVLDASFSRPPLPRKGLWPHQASQKRGHQTQEGLTLQTARQTQVLWPVLSARPRRSQKLLRSPSWPPNCGLSRSGCGLLIRSQAPQTKCAPCCRLAAPPPPSTRPVPLSASAPPAPARGPRGRRRRRTLSCGGGRVNGVCEPRADSRDKPALPPSGIYGGSEILFAPLPSLGRDEITPGEETRPAPGGSGCIGDGLIKSHSGHISTCFRC